MTTTVSPTAILLVGPPGSGKSTWRKRHLESVEREPAIISTDDLIENWGLDHGMNYAEAFGACDLKTIEKTAKDLFAKAVEDAQDVVIDRTNMRGKSRRKWLSNLPKSYRKVAVVFEVPREELDRRLAARAEATGKTIPRKVVNDMLASYEVPTTDEFDEVRKP